MLAVRCGVSLEDNQLNPEKDWAVLSSEINPSFNTDLVHQAFQVDNSLHIFTSATAISALQNLWKTFPEDKRKAFKPTNLMACGVGSTTDTLVKTIQQFKPELRWTFPDLAQQGIRENGLQWTLEQLEKKGLIPKSDLFLWCKTWSSSAKILGDYRNTRQWTSWRAAALEIYSLCTRSNSLPSEVVVALVQKEPICFGVKSAEVLDATITLLSEHLHKNSASDLPRNIHFSVWEKSALQRAQQLFLQSRLIPLAEFESHLARRDNT